MASASAPSGCQSLSAMKSETDVPVARSSTSPSSSGWKLLYCHASPGGPSISSPVQRDVPQIHSVVRVRVVAEGRKAALPVADARRHREQVAQRDLSEPGIPRRQLGQVVGHRILDASDQPLVDRDPDERRHERLRGGERRLQALASRAAEVALADEAVLVDDEKRASCPSRAGARRVPSLRRSRRGRPRRRREEDSREHLPVSAAPGTCAGRPRPTRARSRPERSWTRRSTTTPSRTRRAPPHDQSRGRRPRPGTTDAPAAPSSSPAHARCLGDDGPRDSRVPRRVTPSRPARSLCGGDTCRSPGAPSRRRRARRSRGARFR